jgi:hypothetical protein
VRVSHDVTVAIDDHTRADLLLHPDQCAVAVAGFDLPLAGSQHLNDAWRNWLTSFLTALLN